MSLGARGYGPGPGIRFGPPGGVPQAVKSLLIANGVIFLLQTFGGQDPISISRNFGLVPAEVFAGGKIWQLITYMFLHGSPMHLLFNMLWLWMFGSTIENHWGSREFLTYYFVCGVGAALTTWITGPNTTIPTVGASGAIMGIMVAFAMMFPDQIIYFNLFIPIKVKYFVLIYIGLDLIFVGRGDGIARIAHLGGALFGFLYIKQDWRLGHLGRKARATKARWQMQQNTRRQAHQQETAATVDEILEKIHKHGLDSLTPRERQILDDASRQ